MRNFSCARSSENAMKLKSFSRPAFAIALLATISFSPVITKAANADSSIVAKVSQGDARLAKLENLMFGYVNAERTNAGLKPF